MDYLRNKRLLAKEWLDKLKKSFSARSFNSNNRASLRKTAATSGEASGPESGPPEKLRLEDMKLMVEEGQFICDVDSIQVDESGAAVEGGAMPSRTAQARELNKAQTAVTAAEEVQTLIFTSLLFVTLNLARTNGVVAISCSRTVGLG